jgi:hypothetical protein
MQFALPIGLALSKPLLERLDTIARSRGVSRSTVARTCLVKGLAEYDRERGTDPFQADVADLSRTWRPRGRPQDEPVSSVESG